jgi:hypothetical protein
MELLRSWLNWILGLFGRGAQSPSTSSSKNLEQPSLFQDDTD